MAQTTTQEPTNNNSTPNIAITTGSILTTTIAQSVKTTSSAPNVTELFNASVGTTSTSWMTTIDDGDGNASECAQGLVWINNHLGQCVESPAQLLAFSAAIIAIALWLVAHAIMLKSQRDEPDSSCSRLCLIIVVGLGSVFNLVGCTLCDQLGTQVLTACYLVFSDVVFLLQWIRLWNRNRKLNMQGLSFYVASDDWKSPDRTREEHAMNGGDSQVLCLCIPCFVTVFFTMVIPWQQTRPGPGRAAMAMSSSGRKLLMVSETPTDNFGYIMGFAAIVFYTAGKIPTLINIMKHKITFKEPLAAQFLVISANICYLISIVAFDTDPTFLINAIPWLLISMFLIGLSSILIFLVMRNRSVGPKSRGPVGRRRADGTFLLFPSEESLTSDLERSGTLRFADDASSTTAPNKLPCIEEEPHLEVPDHDETGITRDDLVDTNNDFDAETASIHSRASDFILDDDEDLYVRGNEEDDAVRSGRERRVKQYDDDGLEWDFDDFRPKYTDVNVGLHNGLSPTGSPVRHHSFGIPADDDDWDEEKVLSEIEKELRLTDDEEGDTISMDYDTADEDDQYHQQGGYTYMSQSL